MSIFRHMVFGLVAVAAGFGTPLPAQAQAPVRSDLLNRLGPDVVRYCGPAIQEFAGLSDESAARQEVKSALLSYFRERSTIDRTGRPVEVREWDDEARLASAVSHVLQYTDKPNISRQKLRACLEGRAMVLAGTSVGYLTIAVSGNVGATIDRIVGDKKHFVCMGVHAALPCVLPLNAGETYVLEGSASDYTTKTPRPLGTFSRTFTMKAGDSEVWMPFADK